MRFGQNLLVPSKKKKRVCLKSANQVHELAKSKKNLQKTIFNISVLISLFVKSQLRFKFLVEKVSHYLTFAVKLKV